MHRGSDLRTRCKDNGVLVYSSLHSCRNPSLHGALRHTICCFSHETLRPNSHCQSSPYHFPFEPPWAQVGDSLFHFFESLWARLDPPYFCLFLTQVLTFFL